MIEEIDVSTLVRNELMRTEPHLASAASFLSVVSGGASRNKLEQKTEAMVERSSDVAYAGSVDVAADAAVMTTETIADVGAAVPSGPSPWEIKYAERRRVTRITAAKSLLKDELKKRNPSSVSIAAFRKAAYGDESKAETNLDTGGEATGGANCADVATSEIIDPSEMQVDESAPKMTVDKQPREIEVNMQQGNEILISEEEVMSTGDSEEEEDGSDGFSDHSISGGESARSQGSRKRRAEESPERDVTGSVRREFLGLVSRSEAGCRIHLPSTTDNMDAAPDATTSPTTAEANAAPDATTPLTAVEANAAPDATTPPTTVGANAVPDAPTPSTIEEATAAGNVLTPPTTGELPVAPKTPVHSTTDESISNIKDVGTDTTAVACREQALAPLSVVLPSEILVANEIAVPADVARPLAVEGWGRDASMVEGIFHIIEGLEPPWVTLNVLEVAALQFPMVGQGSTASYNYDNTYVIAALCLKTNPGRIASWAAYGPRRKRVCGIRPRLCGQI